jgi:hypothetical protein
MDYNDAGIFQINERSSLNSVYVVIRVQNRFSGGEFSQTLECKRDNTIDLNAVLKRPDKMIFRNSYGFDSDQGEM